jgi:hypothetical protein
MKATAMSGKVYVDAINIFLSSIIVNSSIDLPIYFILTIVGFKNSGQ